ncbi:putative esterase of the alpha-beta hydrolase superfamily [Thioflavicoccus mobilis 8321]|uniref:Putative esterase of the alpha-beta hydrolase superfamily n=1 Tax=Thioflavicoccus mobilis 8321 TaxID=765912 RepID=L0H1U1_9GAMM|nr:DUF3376 domain-containing protein [Thioflavicoccus mobilis]AGA92206.1 putative esterase of the alpha-beta hydrolase superfamily [Thioflavicoccus mobilis 8321]
MSAQVNLGLTFYGGVSLAVFEAGIAYELVRAVQFSRTGDSRRHGLPEIHVDVITGTSAGGLAAVQLAAALGGTDTEAVLAAMVSIWANDADIEALLPTADFDRQGFLDNQRLRDRVGNVLERAAQDSGEPRLEDDLDAFLTLTNLSGLREPVVLAEDPTAPTFPTTRHVEYERFRADDVTDAKQWPRFVDAAAITAGFPVAFPPALKPSTEIDEGKPDSERTRFVYVDGGVMDNRPLGLALDAIAEKPSPQRLFFFIDPNETWLPPSYGAADLDERRLDPWGIYSKIGVVARSDSIFNDLVRVRGMYQDLDLLSSLAGQVFANERFREELLDVYPRVVERNFNPEAWGVWLLVKDAVGQEVQEAWARVGEQQRFALRARLHEFVDQMVENGRLDSQHADGIMVAIDTAPGWTEYYAALRGLREIDKRFRQLKYRLWHDHFRKGPRVGSQLPDELQGLLRQALADLAEAAARLRAERDGLAGHLLGSAVLSSLRLSEEERAVLSAHFYDYAQAMQVLESLAGVRSSPNLSVRRVTPFDIYAEGTDLTSVKPLAGGSLGAFGGFLEGRWRINDLLVGRLAMRAQLRRNGLIPDSAFADYLAWSKGRDLGVVAQLQANSPAPVPEADALKRLAEADLPTAGFTGDDDKPAPLLSGRDMEVGVLPGSRMGPVMRRLVDSLQRVLRLNRDRAFYRVLQALLRPLLAAVGGLLWATEQSFRLGTPHAGDTTEAFLKRFGWILGWLAIAVFILVLFILSR